MENSPFTDDFPIKTSIHNRFSIAMLNYQRVMNHGLSKISQKWVSAIDHFVLALELRSLPRLGDGGMGTLQAAQHHPTGGKHLATRKRRTAKKRWKKHYYFDVWFTLCCLLPTTRVLCALRQSHRAGRDFKFHWLVSLLHLVLMAKNSEDSQPFV